MDELLRCFKKLIESHTSAVAHFQIWFTLRGKGKAIETYFSDMNDYRYVDFFHAINSGSYKLVFIETASMFDPDDRAASIRALKELLRNNGLEEHADKLENALKKYSNLVSNMLVVRSRIIAHKDIDVEPKDLYKKHGITPNEIQELLIKCGELLWELEHVIPPKPQGSNVCQSERYENATYSLLEVLAHGRNS